MKASVLYFNISSSTDYHDVWSLGRAVNVSAGFFATHQISANKLDVSISFQGPSPQYMPVVYKGSSSALPTPIPVSIMSMADSPTQENPGNFSKAYTQSTNSSGFVSNAKGEALPPNFHPSLSPSYTKLFDTLSIALGATQSKIPGLDCFPGDRCGGVFIPGQRVTYRVVVDSPGSYVSNSKSQCAIPPCVVRYVVNLNSVSVPTFSQLASTPPPFPISIPSAALIAGTDWCASLFYTFTVPSQPAGSWYQPYVPLFNVTLSIQTQGLQQVSTSVISGPNYVVSTLAC